LGHRVPWELATQSYGDGHREREKSALFTVNRSDAPFESVKGVFNDHAVLFVGEGEDWKISDINERRPGPLS
jgi:hypothetical protein